LRLGDKRENFRRSFADNGHPRLLLGIEPWGSVTMVFVWIILIGGVALAIVLAAGGIVIGWVSAPAAAKCYRAVDATGRLIFQITIVGAATLILYLTYLAATVR
jgi:hypothetical protein